MLISGLMIIVLAAGLKGGQGDGGCNVSATISPNKPVYIEYEPLKLTLTYLNRGSSEVQILVDEPFFDSRLELRDGTGKLTRRKDGKGTSGIARTQALAAGSSWSIPLFLQQYFASPPIGSHEIGYRMTVLCNGKEEPSTQSPSSAGSISFRIDASSPARITAIIASYDHELDSSDPWQRRHAIEAIASMDSPAVLPELERLIRMGSSEEAFHTMAKFRGDPVATAMVDKYLASKNTHENALALDVLSQWKSPVSASRLSNLLKSGDRSMKLAVVHYAWSMRETGYIPVIASLKDDPDPYVVQQATRAIMAIEHR
jgi:hypothetical protein